MALRKNLQVTEGVSGLWHYHLSEPGRISRGLCEKATMYTAIPLAQWAKPFGEHFPKKPTWCADCAKLGEE